MSQEKVDAYKNKKADRKANASKSQKDKARKNLRTVIFYAVLLCVVGGIIWSVVNMVGSYKDSRPNYDVTDYVLYDYADATSEETDALESLVNSGAVSVEDSGSVTTETEAAAETTAQ